MEMAWQVRSVRVFLLEVHIVVHQVLHFEGLAWAQGSEVLSWVQGSEVLSWVQGSEVLSWAQGSEVLSWAQGSEVLSWVQDSEVLSWVQYFEVLSWVQYFEVLSWVLDSEGLSLVDYSSRGLCQMGHFFCLEVRKAEGLRQQLWGCALVMVLPQCQNSER